MSPKIAFLGGLLKASLKGDAGGRRAGLAEKLEDVVFAGDDGALCWLKFNFETLPKPLIGLIGRLAGDLLRALIEVLSPASSSSELSWSDLAIWLIFFGESGVFSVFSWS